MLYISPWRTAIIVGICLIGILISLPNVLPAEWREAMGRFYLPSQTISLGLDLQGGSYLLLEVGVQKVVTERLDSIEDSTRRVLRENDVRYTGLKVGDGTVRVRISNPDQMEKARGLLDGLAQPVGNSLLGQSAKEFDVTVGADQTFEMRMTEPAKEDVRRRTVEQSIEVIRDRIDELGTKEPTIQQQGADRVLVQVPGLQDPQQLKRVLGKTARMTFHLVDFSLPADQVTAGREPPGAKLYRMSDPTEGGPMLLRERPILTGDRLKNATQSFSQTGEAVVSFEFDLQGARIFAEVTTENVGRPFAIVLDNEIITAPNIREPITGGQGQISGNFSVQTANELAIMLNAGSYPADIKVIEERTVGAELGSDSIAAGTLAAWIGLGLVIVFLILNYGIFGVFADIGLVINFILVFAVMTTLGATLTLPGIAGLVLSIGMSVDANVLINERIREEGNLGKGLIASLDAGYNRAMPAIIDSNLTAIISCILLFAFGSGPVRGFAVTLGLGVTISMFTAVMVTRLMVIAWLRTLRPKTLPI